MKTNQNTSTKLRMLTLIGLLSISCGAHALCMNADGSLDDISMETALVDRALLPACEVQPSVQTTTPQEPSTQVTSQAVKPAALNGLP